MAYDEPTAERIRKALAGRRGVVAKKLMGGLCFMVGGGMCCSVSGRGGLLVRIATDAYEDAVRAPHVEPVKMGRRVMGGFVRVAPEGYRTEAALKAWIERGIAAVAARKAAGPVKKRKRSAPKRWRK